LPNLVEALGLIQDEESPYQCIENTDDRPNPTAQIAYQNELGTRQESSFLVIGPIKPIDCPYYEMGEQAFRAVACGESPPLTVETTWDLLIALTPTGGLSYHSVIFEPDAMMMHVRLQQEGVTAQQCRSVTLDVDALFRELPSLGD